MSTNPNIDAKRQRVLTTAHDHWKALLFQGIAMLILGVLAITLPNIFTLEIELLVGWLLIVAGVLRTAVIFKKRHMPGFWWSLSNGVLVVILGVLLVARPLQGEVTLTVLMTMLFALEGIVAIVLAFEYRRYFPHWGWTMVGGLINLALVYLIWTGWPNSASWVIGLYVGINLFFFGLPMIMLALAARNSAAAHA